MPIVHQKEDLSYRIAVWEITETITDLLKLARLSTDELTTMEGFKSDSRRREFLTVRALLHTLFPNEKLLITYDKNGKPHLANFSLSISHSKNFVAVLIGHFTHGGIDIEIINDRIFTLANKFLNAEEKSFLGLRPTAETLQIVWGAKEILFKIHSIGDVDFKKHLLVHPFIPDRSGQIVAEIRKEGFEKTYKISFERLSPFMLSWGIEIS